MVVDFPCTIIGLLADVRGHRGPLTSIRRVLASQTDRAGRLGRPAEPRGPASWVRQTAQKYKNDSSARPQTEKIMINPLKKMFFLLKTPDFFRDFLGDLFARVESSGDQNLTRFILHFHAGGSCHDGVVLATVVPTRLPSIAHLCTCTRNC